MQDPLGHTSPILLLSPPTKGRCLIPKLLENLEAPFSSSVFCGLLSAYMVSGKLLEPACWDMVTF